MLRTITTTVGSAMAALCLSATLAMTQTPMTPQTGNTTPQQGHRQNPSQGQMQNPSEGQAMRLLCTRDDGKGNCTAATGTDGKELVVFGEGLKSGAYMTCVDMGGVVNCKPGS